MPTSPPPASWFTDPHLAGPTPLTVADSGRVFGHLAVWGQAHRGVLGERVTPPRSAQAYAQFHVGAARVRGASGRTEILPVGNLTVGGGHAGLQLSAVDAVCHYDDASSIAAQVRVGEDRHGIWFAGSMLPDVDAATRRRFESCALSGDWRRVGTSLELVAVLAVPVPGFAVPRARIASGRQLALVAAGALAPRVRSQRIVRSTQERRVRFRRVDPGYGARLQRQLLIALDDPGYVASRQRQLLADLNDPAVLRSPFEEMLLRAFRGGVDVELVKRDAMRILAELSGGHGGR